ncbi:aminotransferase class I/II-fold pyridoxal phosphate-dependent enzyme [Flavobacterium algicola]|uniref:aminotransferase class I/II-fold pyridoxal phosphate-dependent enzyme n=1 Tax=Flavobacterium algicola TaxID=556529 RepID=UPI001EFD3CA7|nr:pyridoxal phosphate-dependent aminotransferase family protein [Flavobacterium algicola]MCG9791749.1 pyridoxal phosphate-dependent aminotransferase family protein [Flavobacterium algicola]
MKKFPSTLSTKLQRRIDSNAIRQLGSANTRIDFSSNDYIGFSQSKTIFDTTHQYLVDHNYTQNGATGSRLISGNHEVYTTVEGQIANFHESETALIFNSGYDANLGFFSAVPQKNDFILYDELCHASIRDGFQLSHAKAYKYDHNDFEDLERLILKFNSNNTPIYIVTESVFSMDGDSPNLEELACLATKYECYLVIDEAHALGVYGTNGQGLVHSLGIQDQVFAQIMTFGKGLGCHGAAILGSKELQTYLINFARSFIYTTGLSPHAVATIGMAYQHLENHTQNIVLLKENIIWFNQEKKMIGLQPLFVRSKSAIQCAIVQGNENVKNIAQQLQEKGFEVKAILSPTVPEGQERLRFCLHSYNTKEQISELLTLFASLVF